jgi:hypothetical protein
VITAERWRKQPILKPYPKTTKKSENAVAVRLPALTKPEPTALDMDGGLLTLGKLSAFSGSLESTSLPTLGEAFFDGGEFPRYQRFYTTPYSRV